ncbi:MAG: bacteriohemerythrin, partial [Colwellia sp.]
NMTQVVWNNKYLIGIEIIDTQHQQLFDIMNKLYIASEEDQELETIIGLFEELKDYTKYHFTEEEIYFSKHPQDEIKRHKELHQFFIKKLDESIQQCIRIGALSLELLFFLNDWLVEHIQVEDQKYVKYH